MANPKKPKVVKICEECNTNPAQITSYAVLKRQRLCSDCYKKMLDEYPPKS